MFKNVLILSNKMLLPLTKYSLILISYYLFDASINIYTSLLLKNENFVSFSYLHLIYGIFMLMIVLLEILNFWRWYNWYPNYDLFICEMICYTTIQLVGFVFLFNMYQYNDHINYYKQPYALIACLNLLIKTLLMTMGEIFIFILFILQKLYNNESNGINNESNDINNEPNNINKVRYPIIKISTNDSSYCAVCLNTSNINNFYRQLPCNHIFHPYCVDKWMEQYRTCPLCRKLC